MSNVNSTVCEARPEVPTNLEEQVVFGISAIIREADRWNLQLSSVVRLDIYSNSQYMFQTIRTLLENRYPELTAALVWHGVDLSGALHVDFAAILAR